MVAFFFPYKKLYKDTHVRVSSLVPELNSIFARTAIDFMVPNYYMLVYLKYVAKVPLDIVKFPFQFDDTFVFTKFTKCIYKLYSEKLFALMSKNFGLLRTGPMVSYILRTKIDMIG